MGTRLVLPNVRMAFNNLFTAEEYSPGDGKPRYSATFLIEKGSAMDKQIWAAINAEAANAWPKKPQAMVDSLKGNNNKFCYRDGDITTYDGFEGMFALASHRKESDGAPGVYDRDKTPLQARDGRPYSGCYVNAIVEIYAQTGENSGMRCGLVGVQFVKDGQSFGGASKPKADDFEDLGMDEEALLA